ncbi:MAG: hypothetical protein NUV54_01140 [Candidatus Taylorbacteria bacterium]|nr:hypothetical protein [Candidatus Taylorbacteria bacterium]
MDKKILTELKKIDSEIRKDRGIPSFFAIFLRTDILDTENAEKWDLLFSASWINERNKRKEREYIFTKLIKRFSPNELSGFLQKLEVVNSKDPFIKAITKKLGLISNEIFPGEPLSIGGKKNPILITKSFILSSTPSVTNIRPTKTKPGKTGFPVSKGIDSGDSPEAFGKIPDSKVEN